jgi:uncharacterized membrane protein
MVFVLFVLVVATFLLWRRLQRADARAANLDARLAGLEKRFEWSLTDRTVTSRPDLQVGQVPTATSPASPDLKARPAEAPPKVRLADVPPQAQPAVVPPTAVAPPAAEGLETRIGGRWLLYVGIVALVMGVAYFERLAIQNHWINETARVIQGGVVGVLLVAAGLRVSRNGYALYGEILAGGGAAIEYVSIFAAYNFYHLIDRTPAFALLLLVTGVAAVLADHRRSQGLALVGVGGGFATPFLLPGQTDAQIALFGYDTILIAGTMFLAARRSWAWLNVVSYVLTLLTVSAWAARFYAPHKYLVTELFLTAYCAMFIYILWTMRRESLMDGVTRALLWTAPAYYYAASIAILFAHPVAMLVFVLAIALVGAFVGSSENGTISAVARLAFWFLTYFPLTVWTARYGGHDWLKAGGATLVAAYLIQLVTHLQATGRSNRLRWPDVAALHLNGLGTFGIADAMVMYDVRLATIGWIAAGFAVWQAAVAFRQFAHRRSHALHFVALGSTLATIAIGLIFRGPWVTMGWAVEGALIVWLGLREARHWLRVGGLLLFAVAIARLLNLQFVSGGEGLMPVFNTIAACAALVIVLTYWIAWLHRGQPGQASALVTAQLLTLALITAEINRYWAGVAIGDDPFANRFGREVSLSIAWALYSTGLIVAGLRKRYAPLRYVAIAVFAVTSGKVFFNDLAELDQIYRVLSIVGLGVTLLVTSYLYQRFSARIAEEQK